MQNLEEFCKSKEMRIVDHYTDAGVSGGKAAFRRPEMARLLEDVEAGKIDMILFTKLDRWFRNIKEYFKVQEVLEKHRVEWKAIHEDYDTTTANGRMAITIFLAIAQNEREKGAERVKAVLHNKRKNKEACFGSRHGVPGYKKATDEIGVSRFVIDPETEPPIREFWRMISEGNSIMSAGRIVNATFGTSRTYKGWQRLFHNELYRGQYAGIPDYCPAYIDPDEWQRIKDGRSIIQAKHQRCYRFSGLLRCPSCGVSLNSNFKPSPKRDYLYYRCPNGYFGAGCDFKKQISDIQAEKWLLKNITPRLEAFLLDYEIQAAAPKPKPQRDKAKIQEKIRRLNVVYMGGEKSDEEYMEELADLKLQLAAAEREASETYKQRDLRPLREFLASDFESVYHDLTQEEQRQLWRSVVDHLVLEGNKVADVVFKS
jgi:DNA invertase Pin-like site-specific DNA recombinase